MIRKATPKDCDAAARLALLLWPEETLGALEESLRGCLASNEGTVFIALDEGEPVGLAQCQLRHDYVEGTDSSPVGYLEGIYVVEGHRGKGIARELLQGCEQWAKAMGCTEFASDCELDNAASLQFHLKTGFREANRIICFTKEL